MKIILSIALSLTLIGNINAVTSLQHDDCLHSDAHFTTPDGTFIITGSGSRANIWSPTDIWKMNLQQCTTSLNFANELENLQNSGLIKINPQYKDAFDQRLGVLRKT